MPDSSPTAVHQLFRPAASAPDGESGFRLLADGVGLSAPQIGVDLQLVVFGFDSSDRYPDATAVPRTILLNPLITPLSKDMEEGWEGCLSVPGLRGAVSRYSLIRYQGVDPQGVAINRTAEGFHARVVQHEVDHLDGKLFVDYLSNLKRQRIRSKLEKAHKQRA